MYEVESCAGHRCHRSRERYKQGGDRHSGFCGTAGAEVVTEGRPDRPGFAGAAQFLGFADARIPLHGVRSRRAQSKSPTPRSMRS